MKRIAIVGGGPAGISAAVKLIEVATQSNTPVSIEIFDQSRHFYGRSLNTDDKGLLLNTSVGVTSIDSNNPDHLFEYLKLKENMMVNREDFITRSLAASYLRSTLEAATGSINEPVRLTKQKVVDIYVPASDQVIVCTASQQYTFDYVVLALGTQFRTLAGEPNNPCLMAYPGSDLQNIDTEMSVAIAGTSLSAIDVAISLIRAGHSGPISMVSRTGRLPAVRRSLLHDPNQEFGYELSAFRDSTKNFNVDDVVRLLCILGGASLRRSLLHRSRLVPKDEFLECFMLSNDGYTDWERHIMAVIDALNSVWPITTPALRKQFNQKTGHNINRYISSIPLENARYIGKAIESGQLSIYRGVIASARDVKDVVHESSNFRPQAVVTAMGCAPSIADPLVAKMVQNNLVSLNNEGGISVSEQTGKVNAHANVFALGPVTHGHIYTPNFIYSSVKATNSLKYIFSPNANKVVHSAA